MSKQTSAFIPNIPVYIFSENLDPNNVSFCYGSKGSEHTQIVQHIQIHPELHLFKPDFYHLIENQPRYLHHVEIKENNSVIKKKIKNSIVDIWNLNVPKNEFRFSIDYDFLSKENNNFLNKCKGLFLYATSKLDKINLANDSDPIIEFLFSIQPKGQILTPKQLLNYSEMFLPFLFGMTSNPDWPNMKFGQFLKELAFLVFKKCFHQKVFGPVSILFNQYQVPNQLTTPHIEEKLKKHVYLFPIDFIIDDYEIYEQNLDFLAAQIIACNDNNLSFLAGYQIGLHEKFVELTKEWIEYGKDSYVAANPVQFAKIYSERVKATIMNKLHTRSNIRNNLQFSIDDSIGVIDTFNDFALLFLHGSKSDEIAQALNSQKNEYFTDQIIAILMQKLDSQKQSQ